MFKFLRDITYLYESRDRLWKELLKLQQTCKQRDKEYRHKIHLLEQKIKKLNNNSPVQASYNVYTRGKDDPFKANQKEETGEASIENHERAPNLW